MAEIDKDLLNTARTVLIAVFLLILILILVFDVWAWAVYGKEATASSLIHGWSQSWPLLPFLVGMVIAHLFW